MPLQIFTPRWRDLLNRIFVSKRQSASELSVLDDVFPVASLYDETQGEFHLARGEVAWQGSAVTAAGAGVYSKVGIWNPPGSGHLVIIESAKSVTSAASLVYGFLAPQAISAGGAWYPIRADTRSIYQGAVNAIAAPAAQGASYVDGALSTGVLVAQAGAANTPTKLLTQDLILKPGWLFFVQSVTLNLDLRVSFSGYDRPAEPVDLV